jgi:hypothetical protein
MRNLKILKDTHSGEEGYPQVMSFTRTASTVNFFYNCNFALSLEACLIRSKC